MQFAVCDVGDFCGVGGIGIKHLKLTFKIVLKTFFEGIWLAIFAHSSFRRFNHYFLNLTQKSLGINNYKSDKVSGEQFWIKYLLDRYNLKIIFDVGAHTGEYTKLFRDAGFDGDIFLFEPHPRTYSALQKNLASLEKNKIFNLGFSDKGGDSLIFDYPDISSQSGSVHASLFSGVLTDLHHASEVVREKVHLRTLDDFAKENNIENISLLKIDTEGNEFPILKGAKHLLDQDKIDIIQFEFGEMNVVSRYFFKDFYDLLISKYYIYRLLPNGLLPIEKYNSRHHEIFIYQNIVCVNRKFKIPAP